MLVNWLLTSLCRLDDDLTHHLSAEHKMKPSDLKTAEHFILKFKQTSFNEFNPDQGSYLEILFLFPLQPNWSRSVTASRSCRLAVWSKTTRWVGLHLVTCRCCVFLFTCVDVLSHLCVIRWAQTSWRNTSQPSRTTFSRWTSLLSTRSESQRHV